jgi:hypothetical protein
MRIATIAGQTPIFTVVFLAYMVGSGCMRNSVSDERTDPLYIPDAKGFDQNDSKCKTLQFRYLVMSNVLATPKVRVIEIFLDDTAFSEGNLRELFQFLSKQFPEPAGVTITVKTDWRQLPFPTDCTPFAMSSQGGKWKDFDYHGAIFHRREGERSFFLYNPDLNVKEEKKVIVELGSN